MNQKHTSWLTLLIVLLGFVLVLGVSQWLLRGWQWDVTEDKLHTLSQGTINIAQKLDTPVQWTLYYSSELASGIPGMPEFAQRVREKVETIVAQSDGQITLTVVDPKPFSEQEDEAAAAGLQAVPIDQAGRKLYFGLVATNAVDKQALIPFFAADKETFLEHDLAKLLHSLDESKRAKMSVLSSLIVEPMQTVEGSIAAPSIMDEWKRLFDVHVLDLDAEQPSIPSDTDLLVLIHPHGWSDAWLKHIDQYVLRGGHVLLFVDPYTEMQPIEWRDGQQAAQKADKSSDFSRMLDAWGIGFSPERSVLDPNLALEIQSPSKGRTVHHLGLLGVKKAQMNQDDVATAELAQVNMASAGFLVAKSQEGSSYEALLQTTDAANSVGVERLMFLTDPEQLAADFKPGGEPLTLAAHVSGKFVTAFPEETAAEHVKASVKPSNIIVVADTDVLGDRLWVQSQNFLGRVVKKAFANNGDFLVNATDKLAGSTDLIGVRARGNATRSFTRVERIRRQADEATRKKEQSLTQELEDTEKQLSALEAAKPNDNSLVLDAEQTKALQRYQDKRLAIRSELREVRRNLDADIQTLEMRLKWLNILLMPALVILFALWRTWRRRRTTRAGKQA